MRLTCARALAVTGLCCALAAQADQVRLLGGDRISGTIELLDRHEVVVATAYAGTLRIDRSAVLALQTDEPRSVHLSGGGRLTGRLAEDEDGQLRVGERSMALDAVRAATRVEESRRRVPRQLSSRAEVASSLSSGNTDARNFSVRFASQFERGAWRHQGQFNLARERADGRLSKDQLSLGYGLDWFFDDGWFAGLDTGYFQDPLRDVDSRVTLGGNLGHQFWSDSRGALSAELGVSAVLERVGGARDDNPALRWALDFRRFLWGKRIEAFHRHSILLPVDPDRGQLIDSATGVRMTVTGRLSSSLQIDFDYETQPAPGRERQDLTYTLGLGYQF